MAQHYIPTDLEEPVVFTRLYDDVPQPKRAHPTDIGVDLTAYALAEGQHHDISSTQHIHDDDNNVVETVYSIKPGGTVTFNTGIATAVPPGQGGFIYVRSSMGFKRGLTLANSTGLIDASYRGPIMVKLRNNTDAPVTIRQGERIVQYATLPVNIAPWVEAETLDETERGDGGFGSTGTH